MDDRDSDGKSDRNNLEGEKTKEKKIPKPIDGRQKARKNLNVRQKVMQKKSEKEG